MTRGKVVDVDTTLIQISILQFPGKTRNVIQYQYIGWPDVGQGEPESAKEIIHIIEEVTENQSSPVVVHCSSGGGRSGKKKILTVFVTRKCPMR